MPTQYGIDCSPIVPAVSFVAGEFVGRLGRCPCWHWDAELRSEFESEAEVFVGKVDHEAGRQIVPQYLRRISRRHVALPGHGAEHHHACQLRIEAACLSQQQGLRRGYIYAGRHEIVDHFHARPTATLSTVKNRIAELFEDRPCTLQMSVTASDHD